MPQVIDTEVVVGTGVAAVVFNDVSEPFRGFVCLAESEFREAELEHCFEMIRFFFQNLLELPFGRGQVWDKHLLWRAEEVSQSHPRVEVPRV